MVQSFKRLNLLTMVRISRYRVKTEILNSIYQLFFEIISKEKNKDSFFQVIDDIISPSEKIMIAKRIAVIYLLIKQIKTEDIINILKTSKGTVAKFALLSNRNDSKLIIMIKQMLLNKKYKQVFNDFFAGVFIQPGIKKGHWKLYRQHQLNKNKPI